MRISSKMLIIIGAISVAYIAYVSYVGHDERDTSVLYKEVKNCNKNSVRLINGEVSSYQLPYIGIKSAPLGAPQEVDGHLSWLLGLEAGNPNIIEIEVGDLSNVQKIEIEPLKGSAFLEVNQSLMYITATHNIVILKEDAFVGDGGWVDVVKLVASGKVVDLYSRENGEPLNIKSLFKQGVNKLLLYTDQHTDAAVRLKVIEKCSGSIAEQIERSREIR